MGEKTQIFPPICMIMAAKNTNAYANVCKFIQNAEKELTRRKSRATMQSKLNRLIEARYPSVLSTRPAQPWSGKGATAEVSGQCLLSGCWVGREDLPDCHKEKLCEALSMDTAGAGYRFLFIPWIALQKRPTFLLLL